MSRSEREKNCMEIEAESKCSSHQITSFIRNCTLVKIDFSINRDFSFFFHRFFELDIIFFNRNLKHKPKRKRNVCVVFFFCAFFKSLLWFCFAIFSSTDFCSFLCERCFLLNYWVRIYGFQTLSRPVMRNYVVAKGSRWMIISQNSIVRASHLEKTLCDRIDR